jgi:glycosyltransferase involved in cell wall biosynthesis
MAMGGSNWIAGVQYLQSLLYGNSLLPKEEQASLRLYLDFGNHCISDYREVRMFSAGVHVTDFFPAASLPLYRNLRRIASTAVRQRRWPTLPRLDLPGLLRKHGVDVLFAGASVQRDIAVPQICWIPDFQHVHRPDFFSVEERKNRDQHFARVMAEADRVIVSNQCSYADASQLYPETRHKLAVLPFTMYLGRGWRMADARRVLLKYELPKKFLLFASQFWKHKNHATVFRAIQLLRERGIDDAVLVCTGFPHDYRFPNHTAELREFLTIHKLEAAVRVLGLLPRHDQVQLMRAAAAIVQPSLFEGWSAVLEECRSLGKLVFASDIPMHREQLTERVQLFTPTSAEALTDLLTPHWPELTPGPNPELESAAEAKYHIRLREFARQFIALCRGVVKQRVFAKSRHLVPENIQLPPLCRPNGNKGGDVYRKTLTINIDSA